MGPFAFVLVWYLRFVMWRRRHKMKFSSLLSKVSEELSNVSLHDLKAQFESDCKVLPTVNVPTPSEVLAKIEEDVAKIKKIWNNKVVKAN